MKKLIIAIVVLIGLGAAFYGVLNIDFNRLGKTSYYVQITEDGKKETTKLPNGEVMTEYAYKKDAYSDEGKKLAIEFTADKNLRKSAFLKIYVNKDHVVTSYDEVKLKDIPKQAAEKIQ